MIVVDVETTGLVPGKHAIVSIGAVDFDKPERQFMAECRIDQQTAVDPGALAVNGYTQSQIEDQTKPTLARITNDFLDWSRAAENKTLAGHNVAFDIGMLRAACSAAGAQWPFGWQALDLYSVAFGVMKCAGSLPLAAGLTRIKADMVHEYTGLPPEPKPHQAITGAKMEAESFSRLIFGKNLLAEYRQYPLLDYLKVIEQNPTLF